MSNKSKGSNAERELIHLFWSQPSWAAVRVAGSGSMKYPSPDIIAGNPQRRLFIECKITKADYIYLPKDEIHSLLDFSNRLGGEMYIAFRFDRTAWQFVEVHQLKKSPTQYVVTRDLTGMSFDDLIKREPHHNSLEPADNEVDLS